MEKIPFPPPDVRIGGRKFWSRRARREWVARIAGKPLPAPLPDDEVLETSKQLRAALGGVSDMFLWRHSRDGSTGDEAA